MHVHGDGAHGGPEVVQADPVDSEPVGEVRRVGERRRQAHDAHGTAGVRRDEAHAADDHLQHGPSVLAQQVNLVDDHQPHLLHVPAALPGARDAVPLLGRGHQDVRLLQRLGVGGHVARELDHALAHALAELAAPVLDTLRHQRLEGRDVHRLASGPLVEEAEHRQLRGHRLARASGRAEQHVVVCVVEHVEDLRLDGVEVREAEDGLEGLALQGGLGQRHQVQQVGVGRRLVGEHQRAQGQLHSLLHALPAVVGGAHPQLRRHWVRHRDGEGEPLLLASLHRAPREGDELVVVELLAAVVLHPDPPRVGAGPVHAVHPAEVRRDGQRNPEHGAGDGLGRRLHVHVGHHLHGGLDPRAGARVVEHCADVRGGHVCEPVQPDGHAPRAAGALDLGDGLPGHGVGRGDAVARRPVAAGQLAQGRLVRPYPPVHRLAERQHCGGG
mmetsp:Transcript_18092/g.68343  ORF Transcript_18092/g.68343 Transcript_18092/m.68343 type:complete len:442 (-) Transcript_18092:1829-3154(-)